MGGYTHSPMHKHIVLYIYEHVNLDVLMRKKELAVSAGLRLHSDTVEPLYKDILKLRTPL